MRNSVKQISRAPAPKQTAVSGPMGPGCVRHFL